MSEIKNTNQKVDQKRWDYNYDYWKRNEEKRRKERECHTKQK